jgi:O-antigen/teichoic acid export membrane protein
MEATAQKIFVEKKHQRSWNWIKAISITGFAQVAVQLIGFVSGIFILRVLPTKEYALYTLVNTMLGTMTVLADSGIGTGVIYQSGKIWKDREKLGTVIVTGMRLRKKFALGSLLIAVPILFYLLVHHGASLVMTILIILSLIPAFFSALSDSLLEVAPKLLQDIKPLQKNQIAVNVFRLLLLLVTLAIFPWAFVAILAAGIPRIWGNFKLRKISAGYADLTQQADTLVETEILKKVKRILPMSIYYCISGQITVWIISIFGSTNSLAQVGGLGRLSMLFSIFTVIFSTLISPRFARLPNNNQLIFKRFWQVQGVLIFMNILFVSMFYAFSDKLLWLLGGGFKGLNFEVLLVAIGGTVGLTSTSTNQLLSSKGIVVPPFIFIAIIVLIQIATAFFINLGSVAGVLKYSIYTTLSIYILRTLYFVITIRKHEFSK